MWSLLSGPWKKKVSGLSMNIRGLGPTTVKSAFIHPKSMNGVLVELAEKIKD